jgi:hypothetical protein
MNAPMQATSPPKPGLRGRRLRPWHEEMIDYMLANPRATQGEIAKYYGKTESWVSLVINSDMFKSAYKQRRAEVRERVDEEISDRLGSIAVKSLKVLEEKLDNTAKLSVKDTAQIADTTLTRLGYGVAKEQVPVNGQPVTVNVNVERSVIHEARNKLRSDQAQRLAEPVKVIEHDRDTTTDEPS